MPSTELLPRPDLPLVTVLALSRDSWINQSTLRSSFWLISTVTLFTCSREIVRCREGARKLSRWLQLSPSNGRSNAILTDAVKLAKTAGYQNAGTAEFLVDDQNRHYFIEINPRIQVEHTITEEITGIDIVAAQIQIAAGATLAQMGLLQDKITTRGFAIQCRITTEDPAKHFQPDTGVIDVYGSPGGNGVRLDGANAYPGAVISPHYDSMLVKCTCSGSTYEITRRKMIRALEEFKITGVKTNIPFLLTLLCHPVFVGGSYWTTYIDDTPQLFEMVESQNQSLKLLRYLADVAVNGPSVKGQVGLQIEKGSYYPTSAR